MSASPCIIAIVDYGVGNLLSIRNMLRRGGIPSVISSDPQELRRADKLILPGVGHFRYAMDQLRDRGLVELLNGLVLEERKPVLGVCLGAQLLGRHSEEGDSEGLGWLPMDTVAFNRSRLSAGERIPHMGWADTEHTGHALFDAQDELPRFYYVHSFHLQCDDPQMVISTATHGYRFASGVSHGNVLGVQFHPEKSHVFGLRLLKAYAGMSFAP